MMFLSPLALCLALLAALPPFLRRGQYPRRTIASTALWQSLAVATTQSVPRWGAPRINMRILLQMFTILALAFALARPVWSPDITLHSGDRHTIILDTSGQSDAAAAQNALQTLRDILPASARPTLITTTHPDTHSAAPHPWDLPAPHTPFLTPDWDAARALAAQLGDAAPLLIGADASGPHIWPLPAAQIAPVIRATLTPNDDGSWDITGTLTPPTSDEITATLTPDDGAGATAFTLTADEKGAFSATLHDLPQHTASTLRLQTAASLPTTFTFRPVQPIPLNMTGAAPALERAFAAAGFQSNADASFTLRVDDTPASQPIAPRTWDTNHPLTAGLDWAGLQLDTATPFAPAADEIPLVQTDTGALLAIGPQHLRLGFDPAASNQAETLPILLAARLAHWLGHEPAARTVELAPQPADTPAPIAPAAPAATSMPALPVSLALWMLAAAVATLLAETALSWRGSTPAQRAARSAAVAALALAAANPAISLPAPRGTVMVTDSAVTPPNTPAITLPARHDPALPLQLAATRNTAALQLETTAPLASLAPTLQTLAAQGIRITAAPPQRANGDTALTQLDLPTAIRTGDTLLLTVMIDAPSATEGTLTLDLNGAAVASTPVSLTAGLNRVDLPTTFDTPGLALLRATLAATGDPQPANNTLLLARTVAPAPRVAVFSPEEAPRDTLAAALRDQGFDAIPLSPGRMPIRPVDWEKYDIAVLANTPAIALQTRQMDLLHDQVQAGKVGLFLLGGPDSFAGGGYLETPLETLSPLSARLPHDAPDVAITFVLDRSGSMTGAVGDRTRIEIARMAVAAAADLIDPTHGQIGIVTFGSDAEVLLPLGTVPDAATITQVLAQMQPGGGTNIYPGLSLGLDQLAGSTAGARHIVVMTDGMSEPADFPGLLARAAAEGVTVSAIALGSTSETNIAADIAALGNGRFFNTADFDALPSILAQEAIMLMGDVVEEGTFPVITTPAATDFLGALPPPHPITGFAQTSLKPEATALWLADRAGDDPAPLLAHWRVGAGQVAALATAATGSTAAAWTAGWHTQGLTPALLGRTLRQLAPTPPDAITITQTGDRIDLTGPAGTTRIIPPAGAPNPMPFTWGDSTIQLPLRYSAALNADHQTAAITAFIATLPTVAPRAGTPFALGPALIGATLLALVLLWLILPLRSRWRPTFRKPAP
ncbi:Ca-activated chloride channel like protein (plasmid) [Ketogulonicigenium robustum]|uniref:Ca-activated chloride channel like protein n=1 Tax=Ketogulonicigenium robustum TaxID=92947 RepID=A0A1W6P2X8_9RHOB|nr:vWA domain-containing protein [Ketogulonicigenium robustum]ARO15836.1 Ca-activated chloride channel like protein [Ketogulonicigenium robustum]